MFNRKWKEKVVDVMDFSLKCSNNIRTIEETLCEKRVISPPRNWHSLDRLAFLRRPDNNGTISLETLQTTIDDILDYLGVEYEDKSGPPKLKLVKKKCLDPKK